MTREMLATARAVKLKKQYNYDGLHTRLARLHVVAFQNTSNMTASDIAFIFETATQQLFESIACTALPLAQALRGGWPDLMRTVLQDNLIRIAAPQTKPSDRSWSLRIASLMLRTGATAAPVFFKDALRCYRFADAAYCAAWPHQDQIRRITSDHRTNFFHAYAKAAPDLGLAHIEAYPIALAGLMSIKGRWPDPTGLVRRSLRILRP